MILGSEDPLEEEMATYSSILAWEISWTEEPSGLQSIESQRSNLAAVIGKIPWSRKWQPTPVFLPGKSHGQRSLAGYSPLSYKE